jgi:hypothetical protein
MTTFKSKKLGGTVYDLSHLEPFVFSLAADEDNFAVGVSFSCHCFTVTWSAAFSPDFLYEHGNEKRAFDIQRHGLSLLLPDFFRQLGNRSVYWSNKGNFFFWRNPAALNAPYLIFFDAIKSTAPGIDVRIHVRTAHPKPGMVLFASPVKFTTLVRMTAAGKKLKPGPAQQIKRK